MVLNKIKFKKKNIYQISLLFLGIVLVFLIYFSKPEKNLKQNENENLVLKENSSSIDPNKNFFENVEYKGVDKNGNKFVIFSEYSEFNLDRPELIKMERILCYFYFKDGTILEIRSRIGSYNNVTLDMSFSENVNMLYLDSTLFSDNAEYINSESKLVVEGNVKTQSSDGELVADKLNFDFIDKKLKISMYNNEKVNVKTKLK